MFSLPKLATFAVLALGTFSLAAPTVGERSSSIQRRSTADDLQTILRDGVGVMTAACQPLYTINQNTVSTGAIATINAQITVQLTTIVNKCNSLPKDGTGIALGDLPAIAKLLGDLINVVVKACYSAYGSVGNVEGLLTQLLSAVDGLLSGLVYAVTGLLTGAASGLVGQLLNLLSGVLTTLGDVNVMEGLKLSATLSACGVA